MRVMILGAAGQIGRLVTADLLAQTDFDLVLYGRNVTTRLATTAGPRVTLVDGTFEDTATIKANLKDVDAVYYLSFVAGPDLVGPLVEVLEETGVQRFIAASSLDYIILRITWLYNQTGNTKVHITRKGEPFIEAQVTREAVAQVVTDLLTGVVDYHRESLGLGEPGTDFTKPSFC